MTTLAQFNTIAQSVLQTLNTAFPDPTDLIVDSISTTIYGDLSQSLSVRQTLWWLHDEGYIFSPNPRDDTYGILAAKLGVQGLSLFGLPTSIAAAAAGSSQISATSLPLPTNAAQETGGNLASLNTKTPSLGANTKANSTPVNIASDQTVPVIAQGPTAPAASLSTYPVVGAGIDSGSLIRTIKTDVSGNTQVRLTDNTNFMPTMDTVARRGYFTLTDGTNSAPTMDVAARKAFQAITDGTSTVAVKAASTAAVAADPAMVVALSPNNNTLANSLFAKLSDGTTAVPVKAASTAAVAGDPSLVVQLSPNQTTPILATTCPSTSATAACTNWTNSGAAVTVANVKASAGSVYGFSIYNANASPIFVQFYNTAGTPTLGTSVIFFVAIPATSVVSVPPGAMALGNFATGIGIGMSTTAVSNGTPGTAPYITVFYK